MVVRTLPAVLTLVRTELPETPTRTTVRILITGSRLWSDRGTVREALLEVATEHPGAAFVLVHGACRGADRVAAVTAYSLGWDVESHPAEDFGPWPRCGPIRNRYMVSLGAVVCLAFYQRGAKNRGTANCALLAAVAGIEVRKYYNAA